MTLISITGSATASRGYTYEDANEMIDMFDAVLAGRATARTLDRMLEITGAAVPVTASMRKAMQPVRLPGDRSRPGLAEVTDRFWRAYAKEHPAPEQKRRPLISTLRRAR